MNVEFVYLWTLKCSHGLICFVQRINVLFSIGFVKKDEREINQLKKLPTMSKGMQKRVVDYLSEQKQNMSIDTRYGWGNDKIMKLFNYISLTSWW